MTTTNRPWMQSFNFSQMPQNNKFDQLHKLCRNYVASLDLGCPSLNLVKMVDAGVNTSEMDSKAKYLQWVKNWKFIYNELSRIIRTYKTYRKSSNQFAWSPDEVARLKETAQIMLNARHNGKLAAWAIVHRERSNQS